jgi:hypothetical protein
MSYDRLLRACQADSEAFKAAAESRPAPAAIVDPPQIVEEQPKPPPVCTCKDDCLEFRRDYNDVGDEVFGVSSLQY